jgi:acyl-CoA thioesterase-2
MLTAHDLLELEQVGELRFRSVKSQDNYQGKIFGGQALGQSLAAASRTVPSWLPHSCTGYFLKGGAVAEPIDYVVERVRDGRRFSERRVLALQAGKPIFDLLCSFHDVEPGFAHQVGDLSGVPPPENLQSLQEFVRSQADRLRPEVLERQLRAFPVELRPVDPEGIFFGKVQHTPRNYWFRMPTADILDAPRDHRCALAFMSDYWLAAVAGSPHRAPTAVSSDLAVASLNHSLWFHGPCRADDFLLYKTESPWAGEGRGMARGLIYDRDGGLVASVVQEVSLRVGTAAPASAAR